jgi:hypothetical protein
MSDLKHAALARRLYLHVLNNGQVTADDMSRLVKTIENLERNLAKAVVGLEECVEEIDAYIRFEYPHDHPVQERYRQRDYAANPARTTLTELKGETDA